MNGSILPRQRKHISWVIGIHGIVIILIWVSPFLFHWLLAVIGIVLYYLQILFLGDCVLTRRQFDVKKRGVTFYYFILTKLGLKPDMYRVRFVADYIMPWIILCIALLFQFAFHHKPLIF